MHLAGFAVEAQCELFLAVDQLQRLSLDGALDADHALGLLGAQAHGEAHAVLGDHQRDFALFFLAFIGGVYHLHAMLHIEVMRLLVEHIGQIAQRVLGERGGRLHRLGARQADQAVGAGLFQPGQRIAAQLVQGRSGHKPGLADAQRHVVDREDAGAKAAQLFA